MIKDFNYNSKKVLIRVDFNVPIDNNGNVTDTTRIKESLNTINNVIEQNGSAIIISHMGRPKKRDKKFSLINIVPDLSKLLNKPIKFCDDILSKDTEDKINELKGGEVILLENLRFYEGEANCDDNFASKLASFADFYINDAFATAHRSHASNVGITKYFNNRKTLGYLFEKEITNLEKFLSAPKKPVTAILGGAKISTKIGVIKNILDTIDNLIIVGGMAYTFIKAKGINIGKSIHEKEYLDLSLKILELCKRKKVNLLLPIDCIIANEFSDNATTREVKITQIPNDWEALDIGSKSIVEIEKVIKLSKTIFWNGPAGVFELNKFSNGTMNLSKMVVNATENGAFSLVGGGDTIAALKKNNIQDKISYISTGGGAMLEFIEDKNLPAISAIKN